MKVFTILAVMWLTFGSVLAQEPANRDTPNPTQKLSLKAAIVRASDKRLSPEERTAAYEDLASRDPKDRAEAFRSLVGSADETIAAMAARSLLHEERTGAAAIISSRISNWSEANQLVVLQELQNIGIDESLMQIPREVLRKSPLRTDVDKKPGSTFPLRAVDLAATLMANSTLADDWTLLTGAVRARPYSRGLWLTMAAGERIEPREAALADSVYKDTTVSMLIRTAAAAALAAGDQAAAEFVTNEITSFLSRFSNQNIEAMMANAYSSTQAKENIIFFQQNLRELGTLRFLRTPSSELLTFNYLNSANQEIRMTLGLIAATRWPERLLGATHDNFSSGEYEMLLGAVSILHPELASSVETRAESSHLSEVVARLRKHGLMGVFGVPGTVAVGG